MNRLHLVVLVLQLLAAGVSSTSVLDELVQRVNRMEQEMNEMKTEYDAKIDELEKKLELAAASQVSAAFSTRLHEDTLIGDSAIIFGTVDLNIGDGYDEFTGVFAPPVDGVYLLMVYATNVGTNDGPIFLQRNDDILCQGYVTDGAVANIPHTSTCSVVVILAVGDSVRVTGDSDDSPTIRAGDSGFLGHIIVEEASRSY